MLESKDIDFIKHKGIELNQFKTHIHNFKTGFPHSALDSAVTVGNGLIRFSENDVETLIDLFDSASASRDLLKFVPASGAATRMFKHLFEFRDSTGSKPTDEGFNSVSYFFEHLSEFAFFNDLSESMKTKGLDLNEITKNNDYKTIINELLDANGLQYASLPKGLLKFHNYENGARLAIEEHMVEGAVYSKNDNSEVKLHFTVSSEHQEKFIDAIDKVKSKYEAFFGIKYNISFSIQKPSTDIIAVDLENTPLRDTYGDLVFRPGGHGALIENLNDINGDIIFIKNIDNIVPDRLRETTYVYKKVIGAYLIKLQKKAFKYLKALEQENLSYEMLFEIENFANEELFIDISKKPEQEDQKSFLRRKIKSSNSCLWNG